MYSTVDIPIFLIIMNLDGRLDLKENNFNVIYTKEKNWIVARCIEVDVVSQGKTMRSAQKNIKEAIDLYEESFENDL